MTAIKTRNDLYHSTSQKSGCQDLNMADGKAFENSRRITGG
jgi:hypothetical protein